MVNLTILSLTLNSLFLFGHTNVEIEEEYVMVLVSGSGADFVKEWNLQDEYNDPHREKHQWNVTDISKEGNFKSFRVHEWNSTNYPMKAMLSVYNQQGDSLWNVYFNTTGCSFETNCWMKKNRILYSTFEYSSIYLEYLNKTSDLMMSSTFNHSSVWFSVWNATGYLTQPNYPMFIFSVNTTSSYPLTTVTTETVSSQGVSFVGCFIASDLSKVFKQYSPVMTLAMCEPYCVSDIVMILQNGDTCSCGSIVKPENVRDGSFCNSPCAGEPSSTHCGVGAFYATYNVGGGSTTVVQEKLSFSMTIGNLTLVHQPKIGSREIMVNVSEYLGDVNNPGHVNGLIVHVAAGVSRSYMIQYSKSPCYQNERKDFVAIQNHTTFFETGETEIDTGLLLLRCLWFVFQTSFTTGDIVHTTLLYQNETKFFSAPILAVSTYREKDITTSQAATTTEDAITTNAENIGQQTSSVEETTISESFDLTTDSQATTSPFLTTEFTTTSAVSDTTSTTSVSDATSTTTSVSDATSTTTSVSDATSTTISVSDATSTTTSVSDATSTTTSVSEATNTTTDNLATTTHSGISTTYNSGSTSPYTSTTDFQTTFASDTEATTVSGKEPCTTEQNSVTEDNSTCVCMCSSGKAINFTETELKQMINNLKTSLLLNKTELSSYIRTKTSAKDDRPSAQGIGYSGAVLLSCVIGFPILMDLNKIYAIVQHRKKLASKTTKEETDENGV